MDKRHFIIFINNSNNKNFHLKSRRKNDNNLHSKEILGRQMETEVLNVFT